MEITANSKQLKQIFFDKFIKTQYEYMHIDTLTQCHSFLVHLNQIFLLSTLIFSVIFYQFIQF